jgi:hypothetical protein
MKEEALERAFALIEEAAAKGERCPQNDQLGNYGLVPELARRGRIKIEVFAHNWRVATILTGPHAGKHTLLHKGKSPPYVVIDHNGRHGSKAGTHEQRMARLRAEAGVREPSAPRLLTKDELR